MVYMLTFGDIWGILMVNVTIYSIHGSYGELLNRFLFDRHRLMTPKNQAKYCVHARESDISQNTMQCKYLPA
jgi:hypothetical protein